MAEGHFSDESSLESQPHNPRFVRRGKDELPSDAHFAPSFKHPLKIMFWGCISAKGCGRLHVVEGAMNSVQYVEVLSHRLIPQAGDWFPDGDYIFQQDLAPCHTSKKSTEFLRSHNIQVLDWPGNSPDLSPIENLWHIVKQRVRECKSNCKTKQDLINEVLNVMIRANDLDEICLNLITSMPRRVQACIKAKGGPILY